MRMSDRPAVEIGAVSTGSLPLDLALGVGGLPRGRVIELFGPEASGKTTLVYHVIAEAQRRGGICAFIDLLARRIGERRTAPRRGAALNGRQQPRTA